MPAAPRHCPARLALLLSLAVHGLALAAFALLQRATDPHGPGGATMEVAFFEEPAAPPDTGSSAPPAAAAVPAHLLPTVAPAPLPVPALLAAVELPRTLPELGALRPPLAEPPAVRTAEH